MDSKFLIVTFGAWFLFMILAIVNAGIREAVFASFLDELQAHQLSTLTLMILIFFGTFLILKFTGLTLTDQQTFLMGMIWVIMTISFEFLAGHYAFGNSWETLIADYNILKGRIWIFIPITSFISPYLANRLVQLI